MAAAAVALPPKVVGPVIRGRTKASRQIPQNIVDAAQKVERVKFDPKKHLNLQESERIFSMKDIGREGAGISPVALTTPCTLFTEEAILRMRAEIFRPEVLDNCHVGSEFAADMIRAFDPSLAPFIYDAWNSPEFLGFISRLAGIELVPLFDMEIGHCNVSVRRPEDGEKQFQAQPAQVTTRNGEEETAFAWHFDSVPFVCVVMLSDCIGMAGGETAVKTGTGEVLKMRGPTQGTGVKMQGRYIEHQALKARGGSERISMVTSFRPKSALIKDETILTGLSALNYFSDLYNQYTKYRLQVLEARMREQLKKLRYNQLLKREFDTPRVKEFLQEQIEYINSMIEELKDPYETVPPPSSEQLPSDNHPTLPAEKAKPDDPQKGEYYGLDAVSRGGPALKGIPKYPSFELHRQDILQHMAGVFRIFARRGFTEGLAGHISPRDPEFPDTFWTNPFGRHFTQLTAEDMILVNERGEAVGGNKNYAVNAAGFLIHSAIHKTRPDVHAACHMHSIHGRAWSAFGKRLDMLTQDSAVFYGEAHAVYEDFGGVVLGVEESEKLAQALGPKGKALILSNHGLLTAGQTVDEAAFLFTLMDKLCQIQLAAEAVTASGIKKKIISEEAAEYTQRAYSSEITYCEFQPELMLEMELSNGAFKV